MDYSIQNIRHIPHDLDDEVIFFEFQFYKSEPEKIVIDYTYPLSKFLKWLKIEKPDFYKFWETSRKSTGVWGRR